MTVLEMIKELEKLAPTTEVWIDTSEGLVAVDGVYGITGGVNTAIITFSDNEYKETLN